MIADFNAISDIRGERIRLSWTWTGPDPGRPGLKLLRRREAYPRDAADGMEVADLADLFRTPNQGWGRIRQTRLLVLNTAAEGGLEQARFSLYYPNASDTVPERAVIAYFDAAIPGRVVVSLGEVTRIEIGVAGSPPWDAVETLEIFHAPGGGPEVSAGALVLFSGHEDGSTPNRFEWHPAGGPPAAAEFRERRELSTLLTASVVAPEAMNFAFETEMDGPAGPEPILALGLDERYDPDRGEWRRGFILTDFGLAPEQIHYYAVFAPHASLPGVFVTDREWRASGMPAGIRGLENRLYDLLPAIHKQYDEPAPDRQGEGQLRSFLRIFGKAADQLRSFEEGLSLRHDIRMAPPEALPHMARWIGWEPDLTLDELAQRRDIRMAPEIFGTVGTIPNMRALANRVTGWPCRAKEFVNNILLSNAPETIRLWEVWEAVHDGAAWGAPAPVTVTDGFDGGPSAALDAGGDLWLFWHSDRSGPREIWLQRPGIDPQPRRAALDAPDDLPSSEFMEEYPAVAAAGPRIWVFFCRRWSLQWDIWARTFDGLPGNAAIRLTDHPAEDRAPSAAVDAAGRIWLFWQSNRRGPTDIWTRIFDGVEWGLPHRVTTAAFRHESPSAAVDGAGRIWLFWTDDRGDRRQLAYRIFDGGAWGEPREVPDGGLRDESPSAVFWNGRIWLFWHSNRSGTWRIWGRSTADGVAWDAPAEITHEVPDDKEPRVVVDGLNRLRLFWRSQRRGRAYQSRSIDTNDPDMLARLKTFEDRAHYTYDTGTKDEAVPDGHWYSRGTVGLYVTPDTADSAEIDRRIARVRDFVEPFRPVPVRFVWLTDTPVMEETIPIDGLVGEELEDDIA